MGDGFPTLDGSLSGNHKSPVAGFFFQCYGDDSGLEGHGSEEEDDDEGSKIITSRTEWGQMIDFIKNNPTVTKEQYMWEWTIPQIRLASYDFTHIVYLHNKDKKKAKAAAQTFNTADDLLNDLGMPVFNKPNN